MRPAPFASNQFQQRVAAGHAGAEAEVCGGTAAGRHRRGKHIVECFDAADDGDVFPHFIGRFDVEITAAEKAAGALQQQNGTVLRRNLVAGKFVSVDSDRFNHAKPHKKDESNLVKLPLNGYLHRKYRLIVTIQ